MIRRFIAIFALCVPLFAQDDAGPPMPPSPVEPFRQWLSMNDTDREKALADYPSAKRQVLKRKLEFYDKLPVPERERRLQMLELRYYIPSLMTNSAAQRSVRIVSIPSPLRKVVAQRLTEWDNLEPNIKSKILTHENAVNYFASLPPLPPDFPDLPNNDVIKHLQHWRNLSPNDRIELTNQFTQYFDWSKEEQSRTLQILSISEREEMEKTLNAFAQLTPEQRQLCIQSFQKFTRMNPVERDLFLKNAARWNAMTREDRATWKTLVEDLPPLPPMDPPLPASP